MKQYLTRNNVKIVAKLVVMCTVQRAVAGVIVNNNVITDTKDKIQVAAGAFIVGYAVSEYCEESMCNLVDTVFDAFEGKEQPTFIKI